ncbi:hypothetical protein [Streptomyces sp. NPDC004286]|uniref:hypothetical protein n=1 Tax=Streptomyces sp. NPDC004286 TaxID=3364696 RepID=UPI0036D14609
MKLTAPTPYPSSSYDHAVEPPRLQVSGDVAGRTASFSFRPKVADSADPAPRPGVAVRVALRFRIPLVFTVTFEQTPTGCWEPVRVLCDQDDHLASVRAVRPQVAPAAAKLLAEHAARLEPLLAVAFERRAAYALSEVYRLRTAAAEAHRRTDAAEDEFCLFAVSEERAAEVMGQISGSSGPLPHSGPPVVRSTSYGRVLLLCPVGHLLQSVAAEAWSGSALAIRCAEPGFTITCNGATGEPLSAVRGGNSGPALTTNSKDSS